MSLDQISLIKVCKLTTLQLTTSWHLWALSKIRQNKIKFFYKCQQTSSCCQPLNHQHTVKACTVCRKPQLIHSRHCASHAMSTFSYSLASMSANWHSVRYLTRSAAYGKKLLRFRTREPNSLPCLYPRRAFWSLVVSRLTASALLT